MAIEDLVIQGEFEITRVYIPEKNQISLSGVNSDYSTRAKRQFKSPEGRKWMYNGHVDIYNQVSFHCSNERLIEYGLKPSEELKGKKVIVTLKSRKLKEKNGRIASKLKSRDFDFYGNHELGFSHRVSFDTVIGVMTPKLPYMDVRNQKGYVINFSPIRTLMDREMTRISFKINREMYRRLRELPQDYVMSLSLKLVDDKQGEVEK